MTPQEAKEFVRRKVIECVPDMKKIHVGSTIWRGGTHWKKFAWTVYKLDKKWVSLCREGQGFIELKIDSIDKEDIEPRDVRLADVLVAIKGDSDELFSIHKMTTWSFVLNNWNLLDDSLDNQSPETWVALAEMMR